MLDRRSTRDATRARTPLQMRRAERRGRARPHRITYGGRRAACIMSVIRRTYTSTGTTIAGCGGRSRFDRSADDVFPGLARLLWTFFPCWTSLPWTDWCVVFIQFSCPPCRAFRFRSRVSRQLSLKLVDMHWGAYYWGVRALLGVGTREKVRRRPGGGKTGEQTRKQQSENHAEG